MKASRDCGIEGGGDEPRIWVCGFLMREVG